MAVTFTFGTPSETPLVPPTHQADDWLYAICECSSGTISTPSGMSIAPGFPVTHNGGSTVLSVFRAKAVDGSFGNITMSGGTNHMFGVVLRVRGADLTEPQMSEAASPGTGASVSGYAPALVTRESNAKILAMIASSLDGTTGNIASSPTNASLTSVTEEVDGGTSTNDGGGIVCISGDMASPGTVSPTTCTLTSTSFCSGTIAFREAPSTPYSFTGTITIAGSPAANGESVEIWDDTLGERETTVTVSGGAGGYTANVQHNDASRYRAVYDDGSSRGCSPLTTAS